MKPLKKFYHQLTHLISLTHFSDKINSGWWEQIICINGITESFSRLTSLILNEKARGSFIERDKHKHTTAQTQTRLVPATRTKARFRARSKCICGTSTTTATLMNRFEWRDHIYQINAFNKNSKINGNMSRLNTKTENTERHWNAVNNNNAGNEQQQHIPGIKRGFNWRGQTWK